MEGLWADLALQRREASFLGASLTSCPSAVQPALRLSVQEDGQRSTSAVQAVPTALLRKAASPDGSAGKSHLDTHWHPCHTAHSEDRASSVFL